MKDKTSYLWGTVHVKAFTGTAAEIDGTISANVYKARVYVSNGAHIGIDEDATTSLTPLGASGSHGVEYVDVRPGQKISAIGQSGVTSGTLYVTECT